MILTISFTYWFFSSNIISQMSISISEEKQVGTFEQLLLKPISIEKILMIRTFCWSFVNLVVVFLAYILTIIIFSLRIDVDFNIPLLFYIYLVTLISFVGIGYILAGITLLYTKTASFCSIIQYILLFMSGAIMPLNRLPKFLYITSNFIPLPHSIKLTSMIMFKENISINYLLSYTIGCLVYLLIGLLIFKYTLRKASIEGLNSKY